MLYYLHARLCEKHGKMFSDGFDGRSNRSDIDTLWRAPLTLPPQLKIRPSSEARECGGVECDENRCALICFSYNIINSFKHELLNTNI